MVNLYKCKKGEKMDKKYMEIMFELLNANGFELKNTHCFPLKYSSTALSHDSS